MDMKIKLRADGDVGAADVAAPSDGNEEDNKGKEQDPLPTAELAGLINTRMVSGVEVLLTQHPGLINTVLDGDSGMRPLHLAVHNADTKMISVLLKYGANVNALTEHKSGDHAEGTAMHLAAALEDAAGAQVMKLLLEAGANVNAVRKRRVAVEMPPPAAASSD